MLTSTYTLVALSVEQARTRIEVQALLERWRPCAWWGEPPSMRQYEQACDALRQVCEACHWRKLDKFVLPALRRRGEDAARLVAELDGWGRRARGAAQGARPPAVDGDPGCLAALERCCELLLERLEREERELLPLARTMIPGETWFAIANQMLAHDAHQSENRGEGRGPDMGVMRGLPPAEISSRQNRLCHS
ncbi:hypothetical protein [Massilia sp. CFBP9026]|uniref:hypothetical protein n=1 Tax=Massilia sp. CFBP9026 TaxID=3096536 RepID=UPI002A6A90CB|nr:hypothetical protein [Massilia sp. CFBP9026]MDY0960575.1 hypothetical protein [Massilia sp. CFBP9026]